MKEEDFILEESETLPGATDSNAKRVLLGIIVGGIFFVGLVLSIIALIILAGVKYDPIPPKPKNNISNPFLLEEYTIEGADAQAVLKNSRKEMEDEMMALNVDPIIKNTTENFEPDKIVVKFSLIDEHYFNVKYTDPARPRWEIPEYESDEDVYAQVSKQIRPHFHLKVSDLNRSFEWEFNGNGEDRMPIMTTKDCKLQYFDKYIEFEARVQTDDIYGMGERAAGFKLQAGNYSLWNYDISYEFGKDPTKGTFGSHPFFLNRLENKKFIGVFMRNSNAMLFSFWHRGINGTFINYKMVGGIIDLSIFHSADADYIIKKYHSVIGRPYLPPFWGLGFHIAREGAKLDEIKQLYEMHVQHWTPFDSFWIDSEMTDGGKTFTINNSSYFGVKEFAAELRKEGHHIVAMTNPGLKVETGYKYYDMATRDNCLILSAKHYNKPFEGRTLAGKLVWLDYFLHDARLIWTEGLYELHVALGSEGVWISMNEPTQTCTGECSEGAPDPHHNATEFDYIPYRPTLQVLETTTLPMAGYHNVQNYFAKQFYTHNLFGFQIAKETHESLSAIFEERRFLVVSRSTFSGSGHYSSHWIDKNFGSWDSLKGSISEMLNFNMFGISHVGSPVGGFFGDPEEELLVRWYELAAYSPLMLTYGSQSSQRKDVFALSEENAGLVRDLIFERYKLLRFFYTKLFEAHAWGGPAVHPLFFEFPADEIAASEEIIETTFMWGKSLYFVPVLKKDQAEVRAYLPNWRWYDFSTLELVIDYSEHGEGNYFAFNQPLGHITILIKGGSIIPYQSTIVATGVKHADQLKDFPVLLIVAPDHTGKASGTMVVDSNAMKPIPNTQLNTYRHYSFTYMNKIFRINKLAGFEFKELYGMDNFWQMIILDVSGTKEPAFACYMDMNYNKRNLQYQYAANNIGLIISEENHKYIPMHNFESIVWGTADEHNFCAIDMELSSVLEKNNGRTMIGELKTIDHATKFLKYEMQANLLMNNILSFQLSITKEPTEKNWVVPGVVSEVVRNTLSSNISLNQAGFFVSNVEKSFHFTLADPDEPFNFIFTSKNFPISFLPNFIHLRLIANGRHIFGLGERAHKFELNDGIYSIFSFDQSVEETGVPPGNNMWGAHPFYLLHLNDPRKFAAVLFLNSNPMDIRVRHFGSHTALDHLFTGGIIDSFFFWGNSVDELISNYQYVIGKPAAVPYWAFGYHQCRWGYVDVRQIEYMVERFEDEHIPLDGVWVDKDYMGNERDFVIDRRRWLRLPKVIDDLHKKGYKVVVLIDPGLAIDENYPPYVKGLARDAFIMSSFTKKPLVGVSWPGYCVYIDFVKPTALGFWENCLEDFYKEVKFDGLWLDMNEPSNFCDGECPDGIHYQYYNFPLDFYDDLYYNPTHRPLEHRTISMEALHETENPQSEFNYHSLYGLMQSRATVSFFIDKLKKRPLVLSSNTFPGSGRYVGHWLGDNYSNWDWMKLSLSGIFSFQLFGIPFVGSDVCGFNGNTTVELCSRWMQLAAFYPFMRNHNSKYSPSQEPYIHETLASISKVAIRTRYMLSRYLYTSHMRTVLYGGYYFKPLIFEFPTDLLLYTVLERTFMIGPGIKITPALEAKAVVMSAYFPNWNWYDLNSLRKIMNYSSSETKGHNISIEVSLQKGIINMHIKGGHIIVKSPQLVAEKATKITTMQEDPIEIIIAPQDNEAIGYIYFDDDEIMDYKEGKFWEYKMKADKGGLKIELVGGTPTWKYNKTDEAIAAVKVLGLENPEEIKCVKVFKKDQTSINVKYEVMNDIKVLWITMPQSNEIKFSNTESILWRNITC